MRSLYEYKKEFFAGYARGAETEKGIRRAIDAALEENDIRNALHMYYTFFEECIFYDDAYEGLLLFPEYTALFEQHPEYWDENKQNMMWAYKWIINHYPYFYQISREQIEAVLKNYGEFCDRFGYNKRTYYQGICSTLEIIGMNESIDGLTMNECRSRINLIEKDRLSDCNACDLDGRIKYTLFCDDRLNTALRLAKPLFTGEMSCAEVPHTTYANFSNYYLIKGKFKEAEDYADKSWRLISREYDKTTSLADHEGVLLLSYAYTNYKKGVSVFKKTFPYCYNMKSGYYSWKYYYGVYHLMLQLEQLGKTYIKCIFPDRDADLPCEDGKYRISDIKDYAYDKLKFLSDKLDERNGNTIYNDMLFVEYVQEESEEDISCDKAEQ